MSGAHESSGPYIETVKKNVDTTVTTDRTTYTVFFANRSTRSAGRDALPTNNSEKSLSRLVEQLVGQIEENLTQLEGIIESAEDKGIQRMP